MERKQRTRYRVAIGGLVTALVFTMAGFAISEASIPAPGGVVKACYKKNGTLRVIDSAAACKAGKETAIQWNQAGAKGATGAQGATGATGATGVVATTSTKGIVGTIPASLSYVWVGPTAEITVAPGQRLTGPGVAILGVSSGSTIFVFGLCT
jgi:hypothetical protein